MLRHTVSTLVSAFVAERSCSTTDMWTAYQVHRICVALLGLKEDVLFCSCNQHHPGALHITGRRCECTPCSLEACAATSTLHVSHQLLTRAAAQGICAVCNAISGPSTDPFEIHGMLLQAPLAGKIRTAAEKKLASAEVSLSGEAILAACKWRIAAALSAIASCRERPVACSRPVSLLGELSCVLGMYLQTFLKREKAKDAVPTPK